MTINRQSLLEGDVAPHLRRLGVPLAFGLFALTICNVADAWFISRLGTVQLAAFGFTLPVLMFFMGVIFGISIGTTSVLSRVYGSGDLEKMRQMTTDALSLTFITVLAASVIGYLLIDPIFRAMGAGEKVLPLIHDFMAIWYFGLPFLGVMMVGNSAIRATGDTRFPSSMMTINAVVALVLDPFFIFGWAGLPRMELAGAAMAQVIAFIISFAISLYRLIWMKRSLSPHIFHPGLFESWRRIFHVAFPSMLSNQISPISMGVITWMAAGFGREAVAALGVANRIEGFVTIVFYSLGAGTSIFAGQNHGAGNFGRIREALTIGSRIAIIWGFACFGFLWLFADVIPQFFDPNPEVTGYTALYLRWVPISYGALGVMILCNSIFNATGRPLPSTAIIFLKAAVLYIPLAWVLKDMYGFSGIVIALMLTNFATGFIAYVWNRKVVV